MKCLEKSPTARYATAAELDQDLERYEQGQVIQARPVSPPVRVLRWGRRHPALAGALAFSIISVLTLLTFIVVSRERLLEEREETRRQMYIANVNLMGSEVGRGDMNQLPAYLEMTRENGQGYFEWEYWNAQLIQPWRTIPWKHGRVLTLDFDKSGERFAVGCIDERARVMSLEGDVLWEKELGGDVTKVMFLDQDDWLACLTTAGEFSVWDWRKDQQMAKTEETGRILGCARWNGNVVLIDENGDAVLRDAVTGMEIRRHALGIRGAPVARIDMNRKGLLVGPPGKVWDLQTGEIIVEWNTPKWKEWSPPRFSPDGQRVLHQGREYTVSKSTSDMVLRGEGWHSDGIFLPDGTRIVADSRRGLVAVPPEQGAHAFYLNVEARGTVYAVASSDDWQWLLSAGNYGGISLWRTADWRTPSLECSTAGEGLRLGSIAFSADGSRLVMSSEDGTVTVWDAWTGEKLFAGRLQEGAGNAFFVAGRDEVISGGDDGKAIIRDALTGEVRMTFDRHRSPIYSLSLSKDGKRAVTGDKGGHAFLWDTDTGEIIHELIGHTLEICASDISSDGRRIVTAGDDPEARVWDAATGKCVAVFEGHGGWVADVVFDAAGEQVFTASGDNTVRMWEASTGRELRVFEGHTSNVNAVRLTADESRIFTASDDGTVRLWDVETGQQLLSLMSGGEEFHYLALSPDGQRVAASSNGTARIWETRLEGRRNFVSHAAKNEESRVEEPRWLIDGEPARWMSCFYRKGLADRLTLKDICLPATHDSAAYKVAGVVSKLTTPWVVTQDLDILGQLRAGARYLDLRVYRVSKEKAAARKLKEGYFIHHGEYLTVPVKVVIEDLLEFIRSEDGATETVICEFSHFRKFTEDGGDSLAAFLKWLEDELQGSVFLNEPGLPLMNVPLSKMKGKLVVLIDAPLDPALRGMFRLNAENSIRIDGSYANSDQLEKMTADQWTKFSSFQDKDKLFNVSWTLTCQFDRLRVPESIRQLATAANGQLLNGFSHEHHSFCVPNEFGRIVNLINVDFFGQVNEKVLHYCDQVMANAEWAD